MDNSPDSQDEETNCLVKEEFGHRHEKILHYGLGKCFDSLQDIMIKKKVKSKLHFTLKTDNGKQENITFNLEGILGYLIIFVNELCKEDITVCQIFLDLDILSGLDDNTFEKLENKVVFDQKAGYQALKFVRDCMCNETMEIPTELFNNIWSLLCKNCPLHEAVNEGNEDMINWLISNDIDVIQKDFSGNTALHVAVENTNFDVVGILCEAGVPINEKNNESYTALHLAVVKNCIDIVDFLLKLECDINSTLENGDTPLHSAVLNYNLDIVSSLMKSSEDLKITEVLNNNGYSPIHVCVMEGHWEILELFISEQCNMNLVTTNFDTPLHLSVKHSDDAGVVMLLEYGVSCCEKNADGLTPVHIAAQYGCSDNINVLFDTGYQVIDDFIDTESPDGSTPLHFAALNGHVECCRTLIELGANIEATNIMEESVMDKMSENGTIMMVDFLIETYDITEEMLFLQASKNGHLGTIEVLMERFCSIGEEPLEKILRKCNIVSNLILPSGATPVHLAAQFGHPKVLDKLLDFNKEWVNEKSYDGFTPLMKAVCSQHLACVTSLIENAADVSITSSCGMTALHYSMAGDNVDIIKILIEKASDVNAPCCGNWTPLHKAVINRNEKGLKLLLDSKGVDFNVRDFSGFTPLHLAVLERNLSMIKLILDSPADCNIRSHSGDSPLLLAIKLGFDEAAEMFIESNLDFNSYDLQKATPLHIAASKGNISIMEKLLTKGASLDCCDIYNRTPLTLASSYPWMQNIINKFSFNEIENVNG